MKCQTPRLLGRFLSLGEMEEAEPDSGIRAGSLTHSAVRAGRAHAARRGARCAVWFACSLRSDRRAARRHEDTTGCGCAVTGCRIARRNGSRYHEPGCECP
jgi:hypothetical protein